MWSGRAGCGTAGTRWITTAGCVGSWWGTAAIAAWRYATYDYNLYFDRAHYADRLLLVALVGLIWYRPIFLLPFVLELSAVVWQLDYPLVGQHPWTHMHLIMGVLVLSLAAFLLHAATGSRKTANYVFVLLCLIAAIYWWGGFNKVRMGWLTHGHLYLMTLSAYANGWLGHLPSETVVSYAHFLRWFDWPMIAFTVVIEVLIMFVWWRRWTVLFSLAGWVAFHLAVFATTGMFFWLWIAMETFLLVWLMRSKLLKEAPVYTANHLVLSTALVVTGILWTRPTNLSWFDTPMCYTYRFEAVGESGRKYPLPTATFAPYDNAFTLGNFKYLNPDPGVVHIWGVTQHLPTAERLVKIDHPDQALALEAEIGTSIYDPAKAARLDDFIGRFFANFNDRGHKHTALSIVHAPRHLCNTSPHEDFIGQERIERVDVHHVTTFYNGQTYKVVRDHVIHSVPIPVTLPQAARFSPADST